MGALIGRTAELERIDAVLAGRDALPAGLLLHGGPGFGKTTLWREAVGRARERGFRILECSLTRFETRLPFAGLADLVGPVVADVLPALAPPQARALEAALALSGSVGAIPDERAVAFALHAGLAFLARRGPMAVAIDDVQWLDPSSALLLSYAVRRLRTEPVLLVVAQRDGEASESILPLVRGAGLEIERLAVGPLPMGAIHRMIRLRLGASLTRPQLLRVHAASGGNPLHALELARSLGPRGIAADDGLTSLLADRVAALPEATRLALALAAVSADSDVGLLAETYGDGFLDALRPACAADLVSVASDHVRFSHPLIAAAAEGGVSSRRRAELHRRLAGAARSPEVRAAHLAEAADAPDAEVAAALELAAGSTRRRGARASSAALYESAARLTPTAEAFDRDRRRLAAAEAWYEAGDGRHAEDLLAALLEQLPRGDQRCEAAWRLGILRDEAGAWKEALELWREALADTRDPSLRSRILGSLAITAFYTGSVADARRMAADAVLAAEGAADPAHVARALAVQALTLAMSGGEGQAAVIDRALALEAGIDESLGDWSPSAIAAECARHTGDIDGARRHYSNVLARAIDAGDANQEQWAAFGLASTLILAGEFERASELADTVLDIADQTRQMQIPARFLRAHVDAYVGSLDEARRTVRGAIDAAIEADEATHRFNAEVVLGLIEVTCGREDEALRAYGEARRIAVEVGLAHATALRAFISEAEVAAAAGQPEQAEAAMAAFQASVGSRPPAWATPLLARAQAASLAAQGRLVEAARELELALGDDRLAPFERARTLLAAGAMARRLREHARARTTLSEAVEAFATLGTPAWTERARAELARIPGRRGAGPHALTETEAQVAALVSAGRTNQEVATALFVTVKTVEATLTRVYAKLGVRSRAELAHRSGTVAGTSGAAKV